MRIRQPEFRLVKLKQDIKRAQARIDRREACRWG